MSELRHRPMFRITSLLMCLFLLSSYGCTSWRVQDPPIAPHVQEAPDAVRLSLDGGRVLELTRPQVRNDSVVGFFASGFATDSVEVGAEFGVPMAEIAQVEVRETSVGKTVENVLGIGVASVGVIILVATARLAYGGDWAWGSR